MVSVIPKEFILDLIRDDLTNMRLVQGLERLGLIADNYYLNISDLVFDMMGFEKKAKNDALFERYLRLSKKLSEVDIFENPDMLDAVALEIYTLLRKEQQRQKIKGQRKRVRKSRSNALN